MLVRVALRTFGMVIGIVGALLAFIVTFIHFIFKTIVANGLGTGHTPTGIAASILALIGALIAIPFPVVSGALMLIAGIVMIFVAGGLGALPFFVLAVAALLVFLDRGKKRTEARA
jgi:hypothetical protein